MESELDAHDGVCCASGYERFERSKTFALQTNPKLEKILELVDANRQPVADDHTMQTIERRAKEPSCVKSFVPCSFCS